MKEWTHVILWLLDVSLDACTGLRAYKYACSITNMINKPLMAHVPAPRFDACPVKGVGVLDGDGGVPEPGDVILPLSVNVQARLNALGSI